ncbi:putative HET-domain-containing protein [Seiridium cardinale]|uniref:HET-domain-containing protein n=1 Tax=Seiridium cardinale TaxID=138064 RepID=A0ABR2Y2D8_9PEZI
MANPMSHPAENTTLCERCNFLSFDDSAIGGREAVDEDGLARLSFEDAKVQWRPEYYQEDPDKYGVPDYRLIRLEWSLEDTGGWVVAVA